MCATPALARARAGPPAEAQCESAGLRSRNCRPPRGSNPRPWRGPGRARLLRESSRAEDRNRGFRSFSPRGSAAVNALTVEWDGVQLGKRSTAVWGKSEVR